MLRGRVFEDPKSKMRKAKFLRRQREPKKYREPPEVKVRQLAEQRFTDELIRRIMLRQPDKKICEAMGLTKDELDLRLRDPDFKHDFNKTTLRGVEALEREINEGLKELRLILQLSASEMMEIAMSIARRKSARDSDRLAAVREVMDRAQALIPARTNTPPVQANVYNFGKDVADSALTALSELVGARGRLIPAGETVRVLSDEEREERRQLATDSDG